MQVHGVVNGSQAGGSIAGHHAIANDPLPLSSFHSAQDLALFKDQDRYLLLIARASWHQADT